MARIGSKNTAPELLVRRLLHARGYRFRLHRRDLPGSPDIVLASRKKAILVHGCFWHAHDCPLGRAPKSRTEFWEAKRRRNLRRDAENLEAIKCLGWTVIVVWQCEMKRPSKMMERLVEFLGAGGSKKPIDAGFDDL